MGDPFCLYATVPNNLVSYIVLNRNGTANQLNGTSRGFDPLTIFEQMR